MIASDWVLNRTCAYLGIILLTCCYHAPTLYLTNKLSTTTAGPDRRHLLNAEAVSSASNRTEVPYEELYCDSI